MATGRNQQLDKRALMRLTSWATAAAVSLTIAGLTTVSTTGAQRMGIVIASLSGRGEAPQVSLAQLTPRASDVEGESRRFTEAIRRLASDRDQIMTRVGSIERNLDDITGSIKRQAGLAGPLPRDSSIQPGVTAATSAAAPEHAGAIWAPRAVPEPPEWLANAPEPWPSPSAGFDIALIPETPTRMAALPPTPAASATPSPAAAAPAPSATRTEFGVDIGSGSNLDEVRALWNAAKTEHPRLLGGLRPIVAAREDNRGGTDMRLIVGPLANASAAAKLCVSLGAADVMCSTRPFVGQNLPAR